MTTLAKTTIILLIFQSFFTRTFADEANQIAGKWKGKFMDQFDLELVLKVNEKNQLTGTIRLFDDDQQIQDDPLSDIKVTEGRIYFTIPSKKTDFEGIWRIGQDEIEGNFIFPDQSKHPLRVMRNGINTHPAIERRNTKLDLMDRKFTVQQLKEDLEFLKENLEASHPNLYHYISEENLNQLFSDVGDHLEEGSTAPEFYRSVAPIIGKIKCSHTGIRMSQDYREACRESGYFLPLQIYFSGRDAYCMEAYLPDEIIPPGSVLLSINGRDMDLIRETIFSWLPSEGNHVSSKYFEMNQRFIHYFQMFDNSESFEVEYRLPGYGEVRIVQIPGKSMREIESDERYFQENSVQDPVSYSFLDDLNTCLLKISTFAIPDMDTYLYKMDLLFTEIRQKNIKNLVLDLRGNQGGHPFFAAVLLAYLTHEPTIYFDDTDRVEEFGPLYDPMPPSNKSFQGDCYVLVDGGVLSTTGHLLSLIKYHNLGEILGEEPGSSFYCNDMSKGIHLPNTKISANIPQKTFITDVSGFDDDQPFPVDFRVTKNMDDRLKGIDTQLDYVLNLIGGEYN